MSSHTRELIIESTKHGTHAVLIDKEDWGRVGKYKWKFYIRQRRENNRIAVCAWIPHLSKVVSLQKFVAGEAATKNKVGFKRIGGNDFRKSNLYVLGKLYDIKAAPKKGKAVVSAKLFNKKAGEVKIWLDRKNIDVLSEHRWSAHQNSRSPNPNAFYFIDSVHKDIRLHRLVCELNPNMKYFQGAEADHRDNDQLNNIEANLRWVTSQQNKRNRGKQSNNTNGYKGVRQQRGNKWGARIGSGERSKHRWLGLYDTIEDAARAYDKAAIELHGVYACTNFPIEDYL